MPGLKAPPIVEWLGRLSREERERVKSVLSSMSREDGVAFLSQLLGRPVTEAEYLLVMGELGLRSKSKEEKPAKNGEADLDWDRELKWLYSQTKQRILMGREIEEKENVPLPSVDKMVEVASKLIEIAFKYKGGDKDLYSFLREVAEGSEGEPGKEGGGES
jgi:hypothetical protein